MEWSCGTTGIRTMMEERCRRCSHRKKKMGKTKDEVFDVVKEDMQEVGAGR